MPDTVKDLIERDLRAVEDKDAEAALACFAGDGVLIDPHYPHPEMRGHREIRYGLDWVFTGMESLSFQPAGFLLSADGRSAAVEVESRHVQNGGRILEFTQVFAVDTRDGLISRMQSYLPYGPNGIGGFFLRMGARGYRRKHPLKYAPPHDGDS